MRAPLAILCYHRALPDEERHGAGRPYFARGTAVSERNFAAQIRSLARHFEIVGEADILAWLDGKRDLQRPSCWITFDDGYRDVLDHVAPILARHNMPATMFVTTAVMEGEWLPADHWYATLTRSTRTRGVLHWSDDAPWDFDLARDYERFVDGPERRCYLRSSASMQAVLRDRLAQALGATVPTQADLYLVPEALHRLADAGWSIGGHGHRHALLTHVERSDLATEVQSPGRILKALGFSPRAFAYPDGACNPDVEEATRSAGWSAAVTLGDREASLLDERFRLPRFLPTDDPAWVEGVLMPMLADLGQRD